MPRLVASFRPALAALAVLALSACGGGGGSDAPPPPPAPPRATADCAAGTAQISGKFLAPNGTTPIAGAHVTIASAAGCVVQTGSDGAFQLLNVPGAETVATASKGLVTMSAPVVPGTPAQMVVAASAVKLAYVPGVYDSIQLVVERLGFTATALAATDLATANLAEYDAVLLNCGLDDYDPVRDVLLYEDPTTLSKLQGYVSGGGLLYASDWAYTFVEKGFPDRVRFLQPDPLVGEVAETVATVHDAALRVALGKTTAAISFDSGGWAVIDSVPTGTEVLLSGPVSTFGASGEPVVLQGKPYAVKFGHGSGRVTYTSFHNETQTTVDMDRLLEQMLFGL